MTTTYRMLALTSLAAVLAGCGGSDGTPALTTPPDVALVETPPAPAPAPTPTPPPANQPPPPPTEVAVKDNSGIYQLASIASNFDREPLMSVASVPGTAAPDVVGAFRFTCKPSHNAYDDPIVFPGQPGRAHLHTFFGNTSADANSTYASLRTEGESTCKNKLNRSAYWVPAMLNGQGGVVMPDTIIIYYKRRPATDPACQGETKCIGLPRGLRYVFGATMDGVDEFDRVQFYCQGGTSSAKVETLPEAAANCPVGARLTASIDAADCWNGKDLDSADHRSHMRVTTRDKQTGLTACPSSHPYLLPRFTMKVQYIVDETLDRSGDLSTSRQTWHFSSDRMAGKTARIAGSTFHADWFGAWDDGVLNTWHDNCINKLLNCSDGILGDGMKMAQSKTASASGPRVVAMPPLPRG